MSSGLLPDCNENDSTGEAVGVSGADRTCGLDSNSTPYVHNAAAQSSSGNGWSLGRHA
eukprot:CAMPEP_0206058238 /NCGR_PEP_ID=MMETSP1466-20131121/46184_1 /ASSEMBLY_ACC=CAM_ASM_001126 /TAXON_ID=44452 /ORGANISM="Pavlova gyrans, Strain CCMP608" /LENGTH=57 /DNA_ID=CAMNT_0053433533 /DNA_START=18 /DNA_END=188 /DNA_ORIENTATION=-